MKITVPGAACPKAMGPIKISMTLISTILFLFFWQSISLAGAEWFLMSRHGECIEVGSLKRKVLDLGDVRDPTTFVKLMRDKGYQVAVSETPMSTGKVVEVRVPERELSLIFVTPELCQRSGKE